MPFLSFGQALYSGLPMVKYYKTNDYKGGIQNWDFAQDSRGIMYVANNFGLLAFDGTTWEIHPVSNGTKVRSVTLDQNGKVYTGSQGDFGYFFPNTTGDLKYTSLADSLPEKYRNFDETWSVYHDEGTTYFCTFQQIFIFNKGDLKILNPENAIEHSFLVNQELYVLEKGRGLTKLVNDQLTLIPGGEVFANQSISAIIPYNKEELLIFTFSDGIYTHDGIKTGRWLNELTAYFQKALINTVIRLNQGHIAIGTNGDGLLMMNNNGRIVQHLSKGRGLDNRTILSLFQDNLDNLWIGLNNGIAYVELGSPFTLIDEQTGLPGTGYAAHLADETFYLGTNNGLYYRRNNTSKTDSTSNFKLVPNTTGQVYTITEMKNHLLMGHHSGAYQINHKQAVQISDQAGGWRFLQLKENPDLMLEGTYNGLLLYEFNNNQWQFKKKLKGLDESSRVMEQDEEGNIWMTHGYKGVFKIKLAKAGDNIEEVRFYDATDGFPSNVLINVFKVKNRLIFPSEHGIYVYDKKSDRFKPDLQFNQIFGEHAHIREMEEDMFGNIYFTGIEKSGVLKINSLGEYEMETELFNKVKELLNDDLENITIIDHQNIIYGAKEGFIHYNPLIKRDYNKPFNTLIRKVETFANGDSILFAGNFIRKREITNKQTEAFIPTLAHGHNSLRFTFSAPYYDGISNLRFQYYLQNFDKDWSGWSNKNQKEYTKLPEGEYVFLVRAKNIYGKESGKASYKFTVLPPWYRSTLAYIVYVILSLSLFGAGIMIVDRKHKKEKALMALKQKRELGKKNIELEQIAKTSEQEITKLKNEKLQSEIRHKNKELATSTMHLMNKNEFITSIKDHLNSIIKKNGTNATSRELKGIIKDIDKNISTDNDWEQFEFHFDRVHGDFTNKLINTYPKLTPHDIKLCAYLRLNLSTKEIAQLLNITVRGVEIRRYRLRKKLNLDRDVNLSDFILNF